MSEIKRVATPMANKMTVLDKGEEILRSPSSLSRRPLKKATSEGLISLSAEPGNVKFEVGNHKELESEGTRCSSAGRVERKLQLFKKKENTEEQRRNSADGIFYKPQPDNPLVTKINAMTIGMTTTAKTKLLDDEKPSNTAKPKSESSESESESDESESDDEETEENTVSPDEKVMAPIEVKAEFLQCVMSGNYTKAQEICKQILLLEPDNATCQEFHSVIATQIEQDNMEDSDEDDSEEEDDDEDDEEDDDDDDDDNEDDSDTSSSSEESEEDTDDEEFTVAPGLNLLMGGLPIKPQEK